MHMPSVAPASTTVLPPSSTLSNRRNVFLLIANFSGPVETLITSPVSFTETGLFGMLPGVSATGEVILSRYVALPLAGTSAWKSTSTQRTALAFGYFGVGNHFISTSNCAGTPLCPGPMTYRRLRSFSRFRGIGTPTDTGSPFRATPAVSINVIGTSTFVGGADCADAEPTPAIVVATISTTFSIFIVSDLHDSGGADILVCQSVF